MILVQFFVKKPKKFGVCFDLEATKKHKSFDSKSFDFKHRKAETIKKPNHVEMKYLNDI